MTLEKMQLDVITKFGHEDKKTIHFCKQCEKHGENSWIVLVEYGYLMRI